MEWISSNSLSFLSTLREDNASKADADKSVMTAAASCSKSPSGRAMRRNTIITRLRGGLGNQMCQYATGRVLSIKYGLTLKLDITAYDADVQGDPRRTFDLQVFNINGSIASPEEITRYKYPLGPVSKGWRFFTKTLLGQTYADYHPEIMENPPVYL